jgi:hypothetical protein
VEQPFEEVITMSYRIKNNCVIAQVDPEVSMLQGGTNDRVHLRMMSAQSDFLNLVLPWITCQLGDGILDVCEGSSGDIARILDCKAKIDYLFRPDDLDMAVYGIAARVTNGHYRNLTLGHAQFKGLKQSVAAGGLHPRILIHGCVETSPKGYKSLAQVALVPVEEFVNWSQTHGPQLHRNSFSGQNFYAWPFTSLQGADGCPGAIVIDASKFAWIAPHITIARVSPRVA